MLSCEKNCARHATVNLCGDCGMAFFEVNAWATHLLNRPEACQPDIGTLAQMGHAPTDTTDTLCHDI